MQESQAGEKSPSPPQNKFPWEAGFWGEVGGVINQVYTGIKEAINPPPKDPPVIEPWDARFWRGDVKTNPPPTANMKGYLNRLSSAESSDNPSKKAQTSTASGLFQFTERTWMEAVSKLGLPFTLNDRFDPKKSQQVVEATTLKNYERAKNELGRNPNQTELYMYHLLGGFGASKLFKADASTLVSDIVSPAAMKANKALFNGKTVKDLLDHFHPKFGREEVVIDKSEKIDAKDPLKALEAYAKRRRADYESLPTFTVKEVIDSPLATAGGRLSWAGKLVDSYVKQKDADKRLVDLINSGVIKDDPSLLNIANIIAWDHKDTAIRKNAALVNYFHSMNQEGIPSGIYNHLKQHGQKHLTIANLGKSMHGFIFADNADRAFLDNRIGDLTTLVHELEHITQQGDERQFGLNAPHLTTEHHSNVYSAFNEFTRWAAPQSKYQPIAQIFSASNAFANSKEVLANLREYFVNTGKTSLKDSDLYMEIKKQKGKETADEWTQALEAALYRRPEAIGEHDTRPGVWDREMQRIMTGGKK